MGPGPLTVLPAVVAIPRDQADPDGHELVQGLLDAGAAAWISTTDQLACLTLLREAWDERRVLRAALYGEAPVDARAAAAMRRDLRDLEKQITSWLSLLGLTPTDRARLGVAEVRARTKLEELADRRAARLATAGRRPS